MSDDILHTGRADIHHPKGPLTGQAARSECAEGCAWASHMRGGEPLYVQICMLCERINWEDLAEQVDAVRAAALHDFAASMRALAEQAPEGEPVGWPWSAYALAAVKAEEHAGKGFPSDDADQTPDVGTPDHPECVCDLIDVSAGPHDIAFVRGQSNGCRVHPDPRAVDIAEAKRRAREAP